MCPLALPWHVFGEEQTVTLIPVVVAIAKLETAVEF
jgi:hypothetical protein